MLLPFENCSEEGNTCLATTTIRTKIINSSRAIHEKLPGTGHSAADFKSSQRRPGRQWHSPNTELSGVVTKHKHPPGANSGQPQPSASLGTLSSPATLSESLWVGTVCRWHKEGGDCAGGRRDSDNVCGSATQVAPQEAQGPQPNLWSLAVPSSRATYNRRSLTTS